MNRVFLIIFISISFLIVAQSSTDQYLEEANRMYVKGDYEGAFTMVNNYFLVIDSSDSSDKALQLGESIYYFYFRSLFSSNKPTDYGVLGTFLKESPEIASKRVVLAFNKLKNLQIDVSNDISNGGNDNISEDIVDVTVTTSYSDDELTALLKSSLLAGKESAEQVGKVTTLLVLLIVVIFIILLGISIFIFLSFRAAKHNAEQLNYTPTFTPTLIGLKHDPVEEFDTMMDQCRDFADKIDKATGRKNNSLNSAELVYKISREYGYADKESLLFFSASLVYDIGLLGIDEKILKSDQITDREFELIKEHVGFSESYISFVPEIYRKTFLEGMTMHHENLNGSGYPMGLSGDQIPFLPRVLRVVESYLSQISSREYKVISDKETALRHLSNDPGVYDSRIVEILDKVI